MIYWLAVILASCDFAKFYHDTLLRQQNVKVQQTCHCACAVYIQTLTCSIFACDGWSMNSKPWILVNLSSGGFRIYSHCAIRRSGFLSWHKHLSEHYCEAEVFSCDVTICRTWRNAVQTWLTWLLLSYLMKHRRRKILKVGGAKDTIAREVRAKNFRPRPL